MGLIASSCGPYQMDPSGLAITVIPLLGLMRATAEHFQATSPIAAPSGVTVNRGVGFDDGLAAGLDPDSFIARFKFIAIT